MVNNLATTVQNFVRKIWKLIQLLIVEFLAQKNSNVQHCNTCVILPVNTLRHNDVIINKNHGIFEWRQNTTTARWRCTIVFAMIARTICFENTNCGRTPVVRSVVSPTTVYDGRWFSAVSGAHRSVREIVRASNQGIIFTNFRFSDASLEIGIGLIVIFNTKNSTTSLIITPSIFKIFWQNFAWWLLHYLALFNFI